MFIGILAPPARPILAAIAIGFAGLEALCISTRLKVKEPTHSLGALGFVLMARQLTDAPRFIVFGMAVGMGAPLAAGLGGGLASFVLIASAWAFAPLFSLRALPIVRRGVGGLLLLIGLGMYLSNQGLL